jgi:hypothetical protein
LIVWLIQTPPILAGCCRSRVCGASAPTRVVLGEGGISQASLKIPDDRPEKPGREKSRAERAGWVLTDGR